MKRVVYLAVAALAVTMILAPSAMAQDEDTMMPEQNVVVVEERELEQIVGQPLPKSGGLPLGSVLLPAAAVLSTRRRSSCFKPCAHHFWSTLGK